jgi:hypothetical protein
LSTEPAPTIPAEIALLGGLLADPAGLKKRLTEYSAARSAAVETEQRLDTARSAFAAHKETASLERLEMSVTSRRERVEAAEGLNESHRSTIAAHDAEWKGISMPNEVRRHG